MATTTHESLGIDFIFRGVENVKQAQNAERVVNNLVSGLGRLFGASFSLYRAGQAISSFVDRFTGLDDLSRRTGESVTNLDLWSRTITAAGGNADRFLSTIENMSRTIRQSFTEGGPTVSWLASLGIAARDSNGELRQTTDILLDVADAWQRYDEPTRQQIGERLGIDNDTIRLLNEGSESVVEMLNAQARLNIVTEEQTKIARRTSIAWGSINNLWRTASDRVLVRLGPMILSVSSAVEKASLFIIENEPILYGLIIGLAFAIGSVLVPALWSLAGAWIIAAAPLLAIAALIGLVSSAILLLIDDIETWRNGGESVFGPLYNVMREASESIYGTLESLGGFLKRWWQDPAAAQQEAVSFFNDRWKGLRVGQIIEMEFTNAYYAIRGFANSISDALDEIEAQNPGFGIGTVIRSIRAALNPLSTINTFIKDQFNIDLGAQASAIIESFQKSFVSSFRTILSYLDTLIYEGFAAVGMRLIDGLIAGITDGYGRVRDAVNGVLAYLGLAEREDPNANTVQVDENGFRTSDRIQLDENGFRVERMANQAISQTVGNSPAAVGGNAAQRQAPLFEALNAIQATAQQPGILPQASQDNQTIYNHTLSISGININVPNGDANDIAENLVQAVETNSTRAFNSDGALAR